MRYRGISHFRAVQPRRNTELKFWIRFSSWTVRRSVSGPHHWPRVYDLLLLLVQLQTAADPPAETAAGEQLPRRGDPGDGRVRPQQEDAGRGRQLVI